MRPACVTSLVSWARAVEPIPENKMTLFKLFCTAYYERNRFCDQNIVLQDLKLFAERGDVPQYVQLFMRKQCYPRLVYVSNFVQPRIIL